MNNSLQIAALFLIFVGMSFLIFSSSGDWESSQPDPRVDRKTHASAGVLVEATDEAPTMKLRYAKASSSEYHR